ncbi:branched-chain amino acid transport system ATP-binding protein [Rhizobium aquaticum]|uniref:Branched-chain amino acid transport system ATP-binding protein n=1 Tax=Rhizobium aquaticum TaxID=1549636 RepID=A0ABV2J227_9HYPH
MSKPLLSVSNLSVSYGKVEAVRGVSLEVFAGEIVTVIGANGAGKSTLLNAAMGILPAVGEQAFDGAPIGRLEVEDRVAAGLSLVSERRELFSSMNVEDNLRLGAVRFSEREAQSRMAGVFDRFPRLKERRRQEAGTMSGGERQMLAMGRALMAGPKVLMLDEPSLGLAPRIVADIFTIIEDLRKDGVAILLVEQNARAALNAADRAYVMELGEITMNGRAADLANNPQIEQSYLGLH